MKHIYLVRPTQSNYYVGGYDMPNSVIRITQLEQVQVKQVSDLAYARTVHK